MRGEVIWNKASSGSPSTAWGSWLSAKNPILRDIHEYILVFSKGLFSRENTNGKKSTISKEEFLEFTKSIWTFSAESARKVGHPAPFPVELPLRAIKLYTFEGDVVLDPFKEKKGTDLFLPNNSLPRTEKSPAALCICSPRGNNKNGLSSQNSWRKSPSLVK